MPRLPADIRISLKKRGGPTHCIEIVRQPVATGARIRGRKRLELFYSLCRNQ